MANVLHSSVTGADLHEPKGIASANANEVYVADGAASGSWFVLRPVGELIDYMGLTEPTGFLFCDGDTIGNASSNATARANADTVTLFTLLWDIGDTYGTLAIYTSAGAASTFGANAAADYAANKAIALPDLRERVLAGWDNKGDVTRLSSIVDGDDLGDTGGAETVTIAETNLPSFSLDHNLSGEDHTHGISSLSISGSPSLSGETTPVSSVTFNKFTKEGGPGGTEYVKSGSYDSSSISVSKGSLDVAGSLGSSGALDITGTVTFTGDGTALSNTQPTFICTKLIFYGA